jgi:carbonic anhydrase
VLRGYPAFLLSTPIITSNIPEEIMEAQTPINIQTHRTVKFFSSAPFIHYGSVKLSDVENNEGENLKINLSPEDKANNYVIIAGKKYFLNQFHFHYSSEHTVNGRYSKMEIHFVNIAADNSYAVLGVLVDFGIGNHTLQTLFDASPAAPGGVNELETEINLKKLFPHNTSKYYTYSGSLTTPNFGPSSASTNGGPVTWIVFKDEQKLSFRQFHQYKEIYEEANFRLIQPLNDRKVYENIGHY